MPLSLPRPVLRLAALALMAGAGLLASPAAAHPGHGDAHAEPWYHQPRESAPANPEGPEAAAPATVEGKTLRAAEPRAAEASPEQAPAAAPREGARDAKPLR